MPSTPDPDAPVRPLAANTSSRASSCQMLWRINEACNLACPYCFREGIDRFRRIARPGRTRRRPDGVARAFERTGRRWRIHLTGGEPFLYPGFVDLAQSLAERNVLSVNTNLTAGDVAGFADAIDARAVHSVNASYHLPGFPPGADLAARFFENFGRLRAGGFRVRMMIVAYPPRLDRLERDMDVFRARGIDDIYVKIFRGAYKGRMYPEAYRPEQRRLLERLAANGKERAILGGRIRFGGRLCAAGCTALDMDQDGNLTRCSTLREPRGNLFEGNCRLDESPAPCAATVCACPYQGLKFAGPRRRWAGLAGLWRRVFPGPKAACPGSSASGEAR